MKKLLTFLLILSLGSANAQWIGCSNNTQANVNACNCLPETLLDEYIHVYQDGPNYTINQFLISVCNAGGNTSALSTYVSAYNQNLTANGQVTYTGGCTTSGITYGQDAVIDPTDEGQYILDWNANSQSAAQANCYNYTNTSSFDEYSYYQNSGNNANEQFELTVTDFKFNLLPNELVCKSNTLQLTSNLNMPYYDVVHTMTTTANASAALLFSSGTGYRFNAQLVPAGQYVVTCVGEFDNGNKTIQINIEVIDDALTEPVISVCSNDPLYDLASLYSYSGNFSGPGTTVNNSTKTFNPAVASLGSNTLNYAYTEPVSGCPLTHNFNIDVKSAPNVNVTADFEVCSDYGIFDLTVLVSPQGGTFSGTGVSGNNYIPDFAGVGTHTVTYTVTNAQGCSDSDSWEITVEPAVVVTAPSNQTICQDDGVQNYAPMVTPAGGTFSGVGVTPAGLFNPQTSGNGTFNITYSFTNTYGCSKDSTFMITVNPAVTLSIPFGQNFCEDAGIQDLSTFISPQGGTLSGPGITGTNFNPQFAGVGIQTITYSFTNAQGCSKTGSWDIDVKPAVVVTVPVDQVICLDAGVQNYGPMVTPANGTFTGNGITASGVFTPTNAGTGVHTITYTFMNAQGCSDTENFTVTVNQSVSVFGPTSQTFCEASGIQNLGTAVTPNGGIFSGTAVTGTNFNPLTAGVGIHSITYTLTNAQGCSDSHSWNITVNPSPTVTVPSNQTICLDAGIQNYGSMVTPTGGNFNGQGITSSGTFNPQTSGTGTFTITYSFTNSDGCSDSKTFDISVVNSVTVTGPSSQTFCEDVAIQDLAAVVTPNGGTFSGPGITGTNFNPQFAGVGIHNITYSVNNGVGCSDTHSWNITVNPEAVVTIPADMSICIDNGLINFSSQVTPNPSSGIYNFSGPGMSGNGVFTPTTAGAGIHTIIYSYSNSSGCSDSKSWVITVNPAVTVTVPAVLEFCTDDVAFDLLTAPNLGPTSTGGVFSGTGVSGNNFIPSFSGVGTFPVTYTYTNQEGCSDFGVIQVTVNQTPTVTVPSDFTVCSDGTPIDLTTLVSPVSNQFSGVGVSNASFIPSVAGSGTYPITYNYTNGQGCSASDTWEITVVDALNDSLDIGVNSTICLTSNPINLNATNSLTGGTYTGTGVIDTVFYPTQAGPGVHLVEYTINYNSCLLIANRTITVLDVPNEPQITGDFEYCIDDETILSISNVEQNIDYIWSVNGTEIHTGNSLNNYVVLGDVTITVVGENVIGCLSNELEIELETVMPDGDISASLTTINSGQLVTLEVDNEENISSYEWNLGNGQSSTNVSPNVYYFANDQDEEYIVSCVLTSSIGCETTITLTTPIYVIADIDTGTAIRTIEGLDNLNIYPNPTNNIINIEFDYNNSLNASLTDISGKLLVNKEVTNKSILNLADLSQGIYFLKLQDANNNQFIIQKIIIK